MDSFYLINTQIADDGLDAIGQLKKLQGLNLSGSMITDAGLRHLAGLVELQNFVLEHTAISDACLGPPSDLKKLTYIHVTGTRVTEVGAEVLRQRLPDLQQVFR
jgi:hypothetical protein